MKELNLPPIKFRTPEAKRLTMDEYYKFVCLNLKYTFKRGVAAKKKKTEAPKVPFSII